MLRSCVCSKEDLFWQSWGAQRRSRHHGTIGDHRMQVGNDRLRTSATHCLMLCNMCSIGRCFYQSEKYQNFRPTRY